MVDSYKNPDGQPESIIQVWFIKMEVFQEYQNVLNKWLRFIGRVLGYDILKNNFEITVHTTLTSLSMVFLLSFYIFTCVTYDGDLRLKAIGVLAITCQVYIFYLGFFL